MIIRRWMAALLAASLLGLAGLVPAFAASGHCVFVNKTRHPLEVKYGSSTTYKGSNSTSGLPAGPFSFRSRKNGSGASGFCPAGGRVTIKLKNGVWQVR